MNLQTIHITESNEAHLYQALISGTAKSTADIYL
jgi:hypothetical protein